MNPFALSILISAFLLFQVQPIITRFFLPWFGGSPAVWTACLMFFQSALLIGYAYAHAIVKWCSIRQQCLIHALLVLFAIIWLPITPDRSTLSNLEISPILQLLYMLLTSVGLPFMLLAATAPLLQYWFSLSFPERSPFQLYSLSNLGSLVAL